MGEVIFAGDLREGCLASLPHLDDSSREGEVRVLRRFMIPRLCPRISQCTWTKSKIRTGKSNDQVKSDEPASTGSANDTMRSTRQRLHEAFHVVGLAVLDEEVHKKHRDEQDNSLEVSKEQGQVVVCTAASCQ